MKREGDFLEAIWDVANALNNIADSIYKLGLADASTPQGAIEILSGEIKTGFEAIREELSRFGGES